MPTVAAPAAAPAHPARDAFAWLLLTLSPLFMASNAVIGRAAAETVPPVGLAFWRWVAAVAILLPFAGTGLVRHRRVLLREWRALLVLGALGMGVCGAFVYVGLADTTATNTGLIYAASPILILLIGAAFHGERISPRQAAGVALALVGIATILTEGRVAALLAFRFNQGDLWVLGATVAWAAYSVGLRRLGGAVPTMPLFAAIAIAGTVCLLPFYVWETLDGRPVRPTPEAAASIAGVALVASVLAFSTYQKGIALVGPGRAGPFLYLMPVYGAALAVMLLGERFEVHHAIGFALILPGVALASLRPGDGSLRQRRTPGL